MKEEFLQYSSDNDLLPVNGCILAAVSGGVDSMVMLNLYLQSGIKVAVAHCNFSLRADESDGDEELVKSIAVLYNLPFHTIRFNTSEYAISNRLSIQMAARELRYSWFEETRKTNGYESVAVAHNMNDNAETFFINLLRGTGINGLTGMKPKNGHIIRPLLFASREEIAAYALENKVPYREDSSNAQVKYTRNKIRHKVFPILREINADALKAITSTMEKLSGTAVIAAGKIAEIQSGIFSEKDEEIHADIEKLRSLNEDKTLIFELFRQYNLSSAQCDELIELLGASSGKILYTCSHRIIKDRDRLIITSLKPADHPGSCFQNLNEMTASGSFSEARIEDIGNVTVNPDRYSAFLDADLINFPLNYRQWKPGDRFAPFGMNGMKKVSDYLVDCKIPLSEKERVYVLQTGNEIIWLTGYRIDNRFRITEKTKRVLIISI
ncbi:MAG TPA: tRNA lysidine(34) synthetase TilS [Bacteroidales bacterium]|nr:tRNA lysidine(34) synthetase TilS [Bacteroidales bacterium]